MAGFSSKNILTWAAALSVIGHAATLWIGTNFNLISADATTPATRDQALVFVFEDAPPIEALPQEPESVAAPQPEPLEPQVVAILQPREPPPTPEVHIRPGIDKSDQQTPNWIGFAKPTEHAARQATTAQPALDPNPAAPGEAQPPEPPPAEREPPPSPPVTEPAIPPTPAPDQQTPPPPIVPQPPSPTQTNLAPEEEGRPHDLPPTPTELPNPTDSQDGPKLDAIDDLHRAEGELIEGDTVERPFVGPPSPTLAERAQDLNAPTPARPLPAQNPSVLATAPSPREASAPAPKPNPSPNQSVLPAPMTSPTPVPPDRAGADQPPRPKPTRTGAQPAEHSDRESDATSLDEALIVIPGRPAAAEGLEIVTKRPVFSRYVRTVASPANPIYDVTFGRTGQVVKAVMLKSSGYPDVDDPVYNALLAWRAKGERLSQIGPGPKDGLTLTIQVVLR